MNAPCPAEIIRWLRYDGHSLESAVAYCRRIAQTARLNAHSDPADAVAYDEAADRLEAQLKAERLSEERVMALEEENRYLAERLLELERTILAERLLELERTIVNLTT